MPSLNPFGLDQNRHLARLLLLPRPTAAPVPGPRACLSQVAGAVIALQLIKRWRNLAYDRRHPSRGACRRRCCKLSMSQATPGGNALRFSAELGLSGSIRMQRHDRRPPIAQNRLVQRHSDPGLLSQDALTDRWPCKRDRAEDIPGMSLRVFAKKLLRLERKAIWRKCR